MPYLEVTALIISESAKGGAKEASAKTARAEERIGVDFSLFMD
jgi:hypothetical protein